MYRHWLRRGIALTALMGLVDGAAPACGSADHRRSGLSRRHDDASMEASFRLRQCRSAA